MSPSRAGARGSAAVRRSSSSCPDRCASRSRTPASEPDLALHGLEDRRCPLQRTFEAGRLEGVGVEALPGRGLQTANGDEAGRGAEGHVAPAAAREQRAGHGAGEHRHDEGPHDEVPHERGDVDAGLRLEAPERVVVAGQVTGPLDVELGDAGLDLQRGVVGVDDHPTERGQLQHGVAAPAPPHRDAYVARADAALGRHERQRRDCGERAAHDRGVGKGPSEPSAVAGAGATLTARPGSGATRRLDRDRPAGSRRSTSSRVRFVAAPPRAWAGVSVGIARFS